MNQTASKISDAYQRGLEFTLANNHIAAIEQFERALSDQPDDTRVLFALGNTARALGLEKPAEEFYRRVLALEPDRLEVLVSLANVLRARGTLEAAEALLSPALARSPDAPELWLTLGSIFREAGDLVRAGAHYRQALALRPDYAAAIANLADVLADEGQNREALALYDRALGMEPANAQIRLNRAVLHLLSGNLKEGWRDYAARLEVPGKAPASDLSLPRWTGETLKRTRLLVTAEQGIGDQIMFASMLPDLSRRAAFEGGKIVLECEPRLASLFARSFPDVDVHPSDQKTSGNVTRAHYGWLKASGGANAAIEFGSLPKYLRKSLEQFSAHRSFLKPSSMECARWGGILASVGRGPYIGVCWRSSKMLGHRALQYAPFTAWASFISDLPGTVVCVQYDASGDEIATLERLTGRTIFVPPALDQKQELDSTAALLASLDAVVSAPTAVSWLAAGLGVETYKILYDSSWTSFGQSYEPFAPSCRCMMPRIRGEWSSVFAATLSELTKRL